MKSKMTRWRLVQGTILLAMVQGGVMAQTTHEASGLSFPQSIEGRFTLQPVNANATKKKTFTAEYTMKNGAVVQVKVYPASKNALGPQSLDGDASTDASPAFQKSFTKIVREMSAKTTGSAMSAPVRFRCAPQQQGPIGLKARIDGKHGATEIHQELLLFERNGFFVQITTSYNDGQFMQVGLTYTDVAHFIGWPKTNGRSHEIKDH